jgi:Cu/Zn superoxide dismutase
VSWDLSGNQSAIGRAIVVHAATDDCVTIPSNGARLAFGVIGIANVAGNIAEQGGS